MTEYLPIIIVAAIIGTFALVFLVAYAFLRRRQKKSGERNMADREIIRRLLSYAKPFRKQFALVFVVMVVSIAYDVAAPMLVGKIQGIIKGKFELPQLYRMVGVYAAVLVVSVVCTYFQSMTLQRIGQKILTRLRLDLFTHIEGLSHHQLNDIPVGKLVTRVCNDTNAISMMFTNVLVTMLKNILVI
ncbi:MAG: ABC transporter transmembrane domain-containing protein, partial [Candidatus Faecousia sp.]|nr:ABC transporter transmembrane domain-containing protein [Candidatus Faecousia sp.]